MALTVTQQLSIINGDVTPPSTSLEDLIKQSAVVAAISFRNNLKDTTDNAPATSYLTKMNSVISGLYNSSLVLINKMKYILVAIYAPNGDFATVQAASQTAWETFIANNVLSSLEELALVTSAEKTAYDNIL